MKPQDILALTGRAVLLNVRSRGKAPTEKGWQKITLADMSPLYLSNLRANIGVSLGDPSEGLHTIDCDDESAFALMLSLNPAFADTLQSHGSRGGNFWLRIEGGSPKLSKIMTHEGAPVGEWRSTGGQTVIHGTHPSGIQYKNNGLTAITTSFADIVWPDAWALPWMQAEQAEEPQADRPAKRGTVDSAAKVDRETVEAMLMSIPPRPSYDLWLKISAAVRNSLGSTATAIELLNRWSPEEAPGEYERLLADPFLEITFGTLTHHAAENGFLGAVKRFFYNGTGYALEARGTYVPLNEGAVKQHLQKMRVPAAVHNDLLCEIRTGQLVGYIGPVAGFKPGLHSCNGINILVTSGPSIVEAGAGDPAFIKNVLADLLPEKEQHEVFLNWLLHCRRAVVKGRRVQTPAIAITGGKGDGKSLGIEIVNRCLGSRSANAYRFLSGDTNFNKDLLGAELLVMDDPAASKDQRSRVRLAQNIKGTHFAGTVHVEGKNKDGFDVSPVQALIIAVNNDPEHLRVLPELDDSMEDKIVLLKSSPVRLHPDLAGMEEAIKREIAAALPAFLSELEARDMSEAYDGRGRLKCYWNPSILEAIGLLSPEQQVLELIHQVSEIRTAIHDHGQWAGTAATLEGLLTDKDCHVSHAARRLLSWGGACGTFLGRLADRGGTGVSRGKKDGHTKIQTYVVEGLGDSEQEGDCDPY